MYSVNCCAFWAISIHAPREGGDYCSCRSVNGVSGFQSTPPARGATLQLPVGQWCVRISIHASREGGDFTMYLLLILQAISIHAPREGGDHHRHQHQHRDNQLFQSTPPARGATSFKASDI